MEATTEYGAAIRKKTLQLKASAVGSLAPVIQTEQACAIDMVFSNPVVKPTIAKIIFGLILFIRSRK